jgi:hypothetical protein
MDVEEALFRAFIIPRRKSHYVARLANPKTREKILWALDHGVVRDLDPRYTFQVEPGYQTPDHIYGFLRGRGAPERCYVMSGDWEVDGKYLPLKEALNGIGPFLISCIPGRLAFYESDEESGRYILERPSNEALRD